MPDNPTPTTVEPDAQIDGLILSMLVWHENQRPYSLDEIEREMECDPTDSLRRLYCAGLIHRIDGFAWASRAAIVADEVAS